MSSMSSSIGVLSERRCGDTCGLIQTYEADGGEVLGCGSKSRRRYHPT